MLFFFTLILNIFSEWRAEGTLAFFPHCHHVTSLRQLLLLQTVWLQRFGIKRKLLYIGLSSQFFHPISRICLPVKFFDFKEEPQSYRLLPENEIIVIAIAIIIIIRSYSDSLKFHTKESVIKKCECSSKVAQI